MRVEIRQRFSKLAFNVAEPTEANCGNEWAVFCHRKFQGNQYWNAKKNAIEGAKVLEGGSPTDLALLGATGLDFHSPSEETKVARRIIMGKSLVPQAAAADVGSEKTHVGTSPASAATNKGRWTPKVPKAPAEPPPRDARQCAYRDIRYASDGASSSSQPGAPWRTANAGGEEDQGAPGVWAAPGNWRPAQNRNSRNQGPYHHGKGAYRDRRWW